MSQHRRPLPDLPAEVGEDARSAPRGELEMPRPGRLILTAGWNLAESLGLPAAGYLAGAALGGQAAGMVTATGVLWLTAAVRKVATRSVPAANKATEAALAAYPGGIADRVVLLSNGEYEVHYIGVNWPHDVFVNQDFQVISAD
jgi:hypothetical protein